MAACSSIIPYKDQNLDYLQGIEKDPDAYRGQVVSFGGEVKGTTEDTLRLRLVLKIDAPLYYYATGKGNALSYEMLLVTFNKRGMPAMTGIKKGHQIKVLARVSSYEKRKNFTGDDIAVLHLIAFAIADHSSRKDFFRPETPDRQLYESWKSGRLFFEESAQDVIKRCPSVKTPELVLPPMPNTAPEETPDQPQPQPEPEKGIIFDAEEPTFVVNPEEAPAEKQLQEPAPVVPTPTEPTVCPEQEPAPSAAPVIEKTENIEEEPQTPAEGTFPTAKATLTVPTTTPAEELPQENAAEPTPQPQENAPQTDVSAPAKPSAEPATQPAMAEEPAPIAPEAVLPASTDEN